MQNTIPPTKPVQDIPKIPLSQMKVKDIMTKEVKSVNLSMTVRETIDLLLEYRISGAPITDSHGIVISVIGEGDLMTFAVGDGMDRPLIDFRGKLSQPEQMITAIPADSFKDIFKKFLLNPVKRIVVIDVTGRLQGIVSRRNILRAFRLADGKGID